MSIDCSVFILLYRFGLAVQSGGSGPQGADSAPSVLWRVHRKSPSPVKQTLLTGLAVMSVDNADTAARAASTSDTGQL